MGIQKLSEDVLLLTLPQEPQTGAEIQRASHMISAEGARHLIIDFSLVDKISPSTLTELIVIESEVHEADRQLVLCCVPPKIESLLTQASFKGLFRVADSEFGAWQLLTHSECFYG